MAFFELRGYLLTQRHVHNQQSGTTIRNPDSELVEDDKGTNMGTNINYPNLGFPSFIKSPQEYISSAQVCNLYLTASVKNIY